MPSASFSNSGINISISDHLLDNASVEDYKGFFSFSDAVSMGARNYEIDETKISDYYRGIVCKNFALATDRIDKLMARERPRCGDYVKIGEKYVRLASDMGDGEYQYTEVGSFHVSENGGVSYSGGFCFDFGSRIDTKKLINADELRPGSFWFFSQNDVKAHNGVWFTGNFKVWALK